MAALAGSGSHTTMAASTPDRTLRLSCRNSIDPGQSRTVKLSSMKRVVAGFTSTLIWRARASGDESPTVLPAGTVPLRGVAPVIQRMLSSSVVLPAPYGPTRATQRGPLPPFFLDMQRLLRSQGSGALGRRPDGARGRPSGERRAPLQAHMLTPLEHSRQG